MARQRDRLAACLRREVGHELQSRLDGRAGTRASQRAGAGGAQ